MQKLLSTLIIIAILCSCNRAKTRRETKTLDFGRFTIEVPLSWEKVKLQGIDTYVGGIAIDSADTVTFSLGWYSNTLTEMEPQIIERSWLKDRYKDIKYPEDTTEWIIVESRWGIDADKYRKNNISWDTIDAYNAKIVYPIRSGKGTTGVYIDSLWRRGSYNDRFNLYGDNLKPENERKVLEAIRTLKLRKK